MNKTLILSLIFSILLAQTTFADSTKSYPDVDENHANYDAVQYLSDQGVVSGYPDGTFGPDNEINRAELMKMVVEMTENPSNNSGENVKAESNEDQYINCFPDVSDEWFSYYICKGQEAVWVDGYPDGFFKPENPTNRAEAIKIILNAFFNNTIPELSSQESYTIMPGDFEEDAWYSVYSKFAFAKNLPDLNHLSFPGNTTVFNYDFAGNITRKEVAEIIYRLLNEITDPIFDLEFRVDSASSGTYYLSGPDGEEELDIVSGALSTSNLFLGSYTPDSTIKIANLLNGDTVYEFDVPTDVEGISPISGTIDDKYMGFSVVDQQNYTNRTQYYTVDLINKSYVNYDLKIPFVCGASCYPQTLEWAPNAQKFAISTYPGDNQYETEYQFSIIDLNGEILQQIDIPENDEEIWPLEYKWSFEMTKIYYRYDEEGEWESVFLE